MMVERQIIITEKMTEILSMKHGPGRAKKLLDFVNYLTTEMQKDKEERVKRS